MQVAVERPVEDPKDPAAHSPVQAAEVRPVLLPYTPIGHGEQAPAPAREYSPAPHRTAVALVEAAGHENPAVQFPVHTAVVRALLPPYTPAGQLMQTPEAAGAYLPAGHSNAVSLVLPSAHA